MNIAEWSLVIIAFAAVAFTAIAAVLAVRLMASIRHVETLARQASLSAERLGPVIDSVAHLVSDVARIERRIGRVAHVVLDEVEPPVRRMAAVASGIRAAVGAWSRSRHREDGRMSTRIEGGVT